MLLALNSASTLDVVIYLLSCDRSQIDVLADQYNIYYESDYDDSNHRENEDYYSVIHQFHRDYFGHLMYASEYIKHTKNLEKLPNKQKIEIRSNFQYIKNNKPKTYDNITDTFNNFFNLESNRILNLQEAKISFSFITLVMPFTTRRLYKINKRFIDNLLK